jgi:hypothetical protein
MMVSSMSDLPARIADAITGHAEQKFEGSRVKSAELNAGSFEVPTFALSGRRSTVELCV